MLIYSRAMTSLVGVGNCVLNILSLAIATTEISRRASRYILRVCAKEFEMISFPVLSMTITGSLREDDTPSQTLESLGLVRKFPSVASIKMRGISSGHTHLLYTSPLTRESSVETPIPPMSCNMCS